MDDVIVAVILIAVMGIAAVIIIALVGGMGRRKERDKEVERYEKESEDLKTQLRNKEISQEMYERLKKDLEEQHQKAMTRNHS
jgi:uncharacterized membrane protein